MSLSLEERANNLTSKEKAEVIDSFNKVKGKMYADRDALELLFKKFDKYIEPYPLKNMGCNGCRVMVIEFWKRVIDLWNK